jgi:hypothetical protein
MRRRLLIPVKVMSTGSMSERAETGPFGAHSARTLLLPVSVNANGNGIVAVCGDG